MSENRKPAVPVLTVSMNPAIDQTVELDQLRPGQVQQVRSVAKHAGGKGINVAACLADWGLPVTVTGVLGRDNQGLFERLFQQKGIVDQCLRADGETRTNIKISDAFLGDTTDVNLPGLVLTPAEVEGVLARIETHLRQGRDALAPEDPAPLVVAGGSLPQGVDARFYVQLTALVNRMGGRTILDTSGAALKEVLETRSGPMPLCIKPNRSELEQWAQCALSSHEALIGTARQLISRGIPLIVVSMGGDGALFVTEKAALRVALAKVTPISTVGAGDAMVAGIASSLCLAPDLSDVSVLASVAQRACAFSVAKLSALGAQIPSVALVRDLETQAQIDLLESPA